MQTQNPVVDVVFTLNGTAVPRYHGEELWREIKRLLPALDGDDTVGIHPIHGAITAADVLLLSKRAVLTIRVRRERAEALMPLNGKTLHINGNPLRIVTSKVRELVAYNAVHANYVVTDSTEECAFAADIQSQLDVMRIMCTLLCGKSHHLPNQDKEMLAYSLALCDLTPEASLQIQETGLGHHHKLGCGIFVPHKSFTTART